MCVVEGESVMVCVCGGGGECDGVCVVKGGECDVIVCVCVCGGGGSVMVYVCDRGRRV